jgi:AraC-like DNA-binding protein
MAIAKNLLRDNRHMGEVAERVGYGSISAFGTAFRRHVGVSPRRYVGQPGRA